MQFELITILALLTATTLAGPKDADKSESTFRQYWTDRFTAFTQEQNVPGLGKTPDGKDAVGGKKTRGNNDDGYQFEGYLTYHDESYDVEEEIDVPSQTPGPPSKEYRDVYGFTSDHGKISAAGGSSLLERTAYQQHEKYSKQEKKARQNGQSPDDDKTGIKYKSMFKVETREVVQNNNNNTPPGPSTSTAPSPGPSQEPEKVERWSLRPDVKKEIEKVGEEANKTVEGAAKDKGSENDESALPNSTLMYEAASRAYDAWWNSTLANLSQLRAERAIRGGPGGRVELKESMANCDKWAQTTRAQLQQKRKPNQPQNDVQQEEKEIDRMLSQCKQVAKTSYRDVAPDFVEENNKPDSPEKLKNGGKDKESDGRERDLRIQMEVLANAQMDPNEAESNWKYDSNDAKSKVTLGFDENAKNPQEANLTVKEQVQSYNDQLQAAADNLEEVKKRLPTLDTTAKDVLQYQIKGKLSAKEISALPKSIYEADSGVSNPQSGPQPQNYSELLERNKSR